MVFLLVLFVVILIGVIIRYATESNKPANSSPVVVRPLSARSLEELKQNLIEAETGVEMAKIQYQAGLSNPYVSHIVRDLQKNNLESAIAHKASIVAEIETRK